MNPNDDQRKKKNPLDNAENREDYQKIIQFMRNIIQNAFQDLTGLHMKPGTIYMYGFNIHVDEDGTPHIQQVTHDLDYPQDSFEFPELNEEKTLIDLIEYYDSIAISLEVFGVKAKNITVHVHGKQLIIIAKDDKWQYQEIVELPCYVDNKSIIRTYENGVLDITINKKYLLK